MGQGSNFACIDCKVIYYMGYGGSKFLAESILAFPLKTKEAHNDHEVRNMYGMDYNLVVGEDLYFDNPFLSEEEVLATGPEIVGYSKFKHVNLSGELYPSWREPFIYVDNCYLKCLACNFIFLDTEPLNDVKCAQCGLEKR